MKEIKNKISKLKSSKNARVVAENFAYMGLVQIAGYVFPLITIPYISRVVGVENVGRIAFAAAIMIWIQTFVDWGFNYSATRDVAKNRENKEYVSRVFSTVLWARCFLMLVAFVVLLLLICLIPSFRRDAWVILFTFLMIPGHIFFPDWFFQAMEKMKYISIFNVTSKMIFTIAVFLFIKEKDDYILQPLFTSLGFFVPGCVSMYYILHKWKVKIYRPCIKDCAKIIKDSTNLFVNTLMPNFYNSFSVILLGQFAGSQYYNGIYDAGKKIVVIIYNLMMVMSRVSFPYLVRNIGKHNLYAKFMVSVASVVFIIMFTFAPNIINLLFGQGFENAVPVLRITSFALIFLVLNNIFGTNYLIIEKKDKLIRNITMVTSFIGFAISFPLIYHLNYIGAALTLTISNMFLGVTVTYFAFKVKRNKRNV